MEERTSEFENSGAALRWALKTHRLESDGKLGGWGEKHHSRERKPSQKQRSVEKWPKLTVMQ